ncbi:hypothetical protein ID866_8047 [Astraeus odoratus]|nr:hypothetical protein ID866_8047 [Astraeus odoratus]
MSEPTAEAPPSLTNASAPPRRSSRISSKPRVEAPPKPARRGGAAGGKRGGTKRAAEELEQDGARGEDAKKAKLPTSDSQGKTGEQAPADGDTQMADGPAGEAEGSTAPQKTTIDIGDTLPSMTLKNEKGEDVETSSLTAEKGVVLFLVPKADTPGCTQQACGYRDIFQEFTTLNFDVYCLSADSPTAQTKWQTKKHLPYQLLSDPARTLIGALGAADGNRTKRSHFVFEKGGKLIDKKMPVKPVDSPRLALEAIKGAKE